MSSDRNSPPLQPDPPRRRSSIAGQTFQDLFGRTSGVGGQSNAPYPGPITTAAAQAQRRRLSISTLGLSGSPNQTSPFNLRPRTESISSANSGSVDESPFEDDPAPSASSNPTTPFGRRLSFGARALRDVRTGNGNIGNSNGRHSVDRTLSSPTAKGRGLSSSTSSTCPSPPPASASPSASHASTTPRDRVHSVHFRREPVHVLEKSELTHMLLHTGDGFNLAENLRSRAERSSISGVHHIPQPSAAQHHRAKSATVMEPPAREMPKQAKVPDAFQERILKGDFYMD